MCLSWQRHMYTLKEMGTGRAWFLEPYFFFLKPEVFWNLKGWVWWTWPMAWVTLFCYRYKFVLNIRSCFSVTHLLHTISISPWFVWITAKPSRDLQVEHVCCYFWSFCQSARLSPRKRLFTWKLESRWTVTSCHSPPWLQSWLQESRWTVTSCHSPPWLQSTCHSPPWLQFSRKQSLGTSIRV